MRPRVIIADDDPFIVQLLTEVCESEAMEVRVATDGDQVLEMVIEAPPDLVLLDIMMPSMNGFQVLEEMSCMPRMRDISVIVITAVSDNEAVRKGYQLGAKDYFVKPFRIVELVSRLKTHLMAVSYRRLPGGPLDRQVGDEQQLLEELKRLLESPVDGPLNLYLARLDPEAVGDDAGTLFGRPSTLAQVAPPMRLEIRGVDRLFTLAPDRMVIVLCHSADRRQEATLHQLKDRLSHLLDLAGVSPDNASWTSLSYEPGLNGDLDATELLKKLDKSLDLK